MIYRRDRTMEKSIIKLQELLQIVNEEMHKRDLTHETSPANHKILQEKCEGTFEAVLLGRRDEKKYLMPNMGSLFFLYRGQNAEIIPCYPSLYRGEPTDLDVFIERMRFVVFRRLLFSHPVVNGFFKKHNFLVDYEGLAQHYGLKTSVLDLTSDIEIALFFATCKYDKDNDDFSYFDDGQVHTAILYLFDPLFDNEPIPADFLSNNITPIGLQAFMRPGLQKGFALHIAPKKSIKCWKYDFTFTCEDSKYYYDKFMKESPIWHVDDILVGKARQIAKQTLFSFSVMSETFREFRPKGCSKKKLLKALWSKIQMNNKVPDLEFTEEEVLAIKNEWNEKKGKEVASSIRRKGWFEYEEIEGKNNIKEKQIINSYLYRTIERIKFSHYLRLIQYPDPPQSAEWVNYTNEPKTPKKMAEDNQCKKIPASMEDLFGKEFLTETDWRI